MKHNKSFFSQALPLSLYIHIPWCVRKCPYCDFNSHARKGVLPEKHYIAALLDDLSRDIQHTEQRHLTSIFIGGGTPSLFSPESIRLLLDGIKPYFSIDESLEITLEANPGTIEQQKFVEFKQAGINRLSIGVQSFNDDHLKKLGRIHDGNSALNAIEAAHLAGFSRFNIDLMYGLPQQSLAQALKDLKTALGMQSPHLSWYHLTLEPNTFFYNHPPLLPDDEMSDEIETKGKALLAEHGFDCYEISAFCQNQTQQCKHNRNYWEFGDYLGIGAGAHGKLTNIQTHEVTRSWKYKTPTTYMKTPQSSNHRILSKNDLLFEFMMNALRLTHGVPMSLFEKHTGLSKNEIEKPFTKAIEQGLLMPISSRIEPTRLGQQFLNDLINLFNIA